MTTRNARMWAPPSAAHNVTRLDFRGRSVRCGACLTIVVHPEGDPTVGYAHWTEATPDLAHTWMCYAVRQESNGRLIVPRDWRTNPVHVTHVAPR